MFDDPPNIVQPAQLWLSGAIGWKEFVFGNGSGLIGRPLSMLSFLANVATGGLSSLPFKITNLVIHLICGALVYALLSRLLKRDPQFARHAGWVALLISAVWLLHPIQVSTVLYIVQRMAQLSAMFTLLALIFFVQGRTAAEQERGKAAWIYLYAAVPAAVLAAILSKENGVLAPLLCAVIELGYFHARDGRPRPRSIKVFFSVFLLIPGALALGWLISHPQFVSGGYESRLFTMRERLLTEPRVLTDYMGALLLPRGPALGLYTDDFTVSHGLLSPPTTLFCLLFILALMVAAVRMRKTMPAFSVGIGLYLAGQLLESSIFSLELYFEHRNYLPSIGFFLALTAVIYRIVAWIYIQAHESIRMRNLGLIGCASLLVALSGSTWARASTWSHWHFLSAEGVLYHPNSMRALLDEVIMMQLQNRPAEDVQKLFDRLAEIPSPTAKHVAAIDTVALQCMTQKRAAPPSIENLKSIAGAQLQNWEMLAIENLSTYLQTNDCENMSKAQFADIILAIVDASPQSPQLMPLWRSRFNAARLYLAAGMSKQGLEQTALVWKTGITDNSIGIFLAKLYLANGDPADAEKVLQDVHQRVASWDTRNLALIGQLQEQIKSASPGPARQ